MEPNDIATGVVLAVWGLGIVTGTAMLLKQRAEPVWSAFVPVVNFATLCRLAGVSGWWTAALVVPLLNLFAVLYVAVQLARRHRMSEGFGIALGLTGFGILPILAKRNPAIAARTDFSADPSKGFAPRAIAHGRTPPFTGDVAGSQRAIHDNPHESSQSRQHTARTFAVVFTVVHILSLLCLPGLMVIGAMAFDGANAQQIEQVEGLLALAVLSIPVALIAAMCLTWIFYHRKRYRLSLLVNALPALSLVFAGAVVATILK